MLVALRVLLQVLPQGDVWRCCCQSGVCCKPCFGAGMLVSGCRWKVLLEGAVELACWCCCKGWCFRVLQGGYVLYPTRAARVLCEGRYCTLQGAAVRVACPLWSWLVVPLQGAASRCCSYSGVCALWSWHVGAIAGAAGCCCRIFLRSSRRRSLARGEWLQRKELTKHKFWSCKCTKVQNWEVWGMIRVWFGHDSGYDSETHLFLNSGSFVAWVSFSHREPTMIATQWLQWLDLPDDLGQDLNMQNVKI